METNSDCGRVRMLLSDYSIGVIGSRDRTMIKAHILHCAKCASELMALEHTASLLSRTPLEAAPDQWDVIRMALTLRPAKYRGQGLFTWLGRHRIQSGAAAMATMAIAAWLLITPQPPQKAEALDCLAYHASMSWREPFANKARLGLADTTFTKVEVEAMR